MKTLYIVFLFISTLGLSLFQNQPIDTSASEVNFKISNFGLNTVKGSFKNMHGTFNFNPKDIENSNFDICIEAATINTGNKKRDKDLRSEDFFEVEKYPNICFKSTTVEKFDGKYITKGNLTVHGVTKVVEIPFEMTNNTFTGYFEIERLDYNVGKDTGTFMVGNTVKITIRCVIKS
ncbi:MAG TPA: YceI family protein [Xanthomarina sp.]|nr:YceI family protein [Xanthomarina sp.]